MQMNLPNSLSFIKKTLYNDHQISSTTSALYAKIFNQIHYSSGYQVLVRQVNELINFSNYIYITCCDLFNIAEYFIQQLIFRNLSQPCKIVSFLRGLMWGLLRCPSGANNFHIKSEVIFLSGQNFADQPFYLQSCAIMSDLCICKIVFRAEFSISIRFYHLSDFS